MSVDALVLGAVAVLDMMFLVNLRRRRNQAVQEAVQKERMTRSLMRAVRQEIAEDEIAQKAEFVEVG